MKALTPLLNVLDAARSVRWYCDKLGFGIDNRFEANGKLVWAHISRGPVQMMINERPSGLCGLRAKGARLVHRRNMAYEIK